MIPNQYIIKRWTNEAKIKEFSDKRELVMPADPKLRSKIRCNDLDLLFTYFTRRASQSEDTYKFALDVYDKSLAQVEIYLKELSCGKVGEVDTSILDNEERAVRDIEENCDTNTTKVRGVKIKGRGRGKGGLGRSCGRGNGSARFKSSLEKGKRNKKPHCSTSNAHVFIFNMKFLQYYIFDLTGYIYILIIDWSM
ncbi:hypothetical protein TanjilG_21071 [Lupinus angustifolius]|uniref:Protein FAR1-RELATED SEQUENCE n=1 Tax=Lupinus angustifolius TaxID=3871 RepID=A0A1J7I5I0_LUPAN|nr:hypothetical protein TanjilG_21071 [Lupinus angustifolius]